MSGVVDRGAHLGVVQALAPDTDELRVEVDLDGVDAFDGADFLGYCLLAVPARHVRNGVGDVVSHLELLSS